MTQPPPPVPTDPYAPPADAGPRADLGRIGFVFAVIAVVLTALQQVLFSFVPLILATLALSVSAFSVANAVFAVIHSAIAIVALILGVMGAQRRRSLVHSGIAIGVGAAGVISGIIGLAVVPVIGLLV